MNALARIPLWFWYLFSVAYCYAIWNPYYSVYHLMWSPTVAPPVKALVAAIIAIIGSLYLMEGRRTMNVLGFILFIAFFGCLFWLAAYLGVHQSGTLQWWGQWIVGLFLMLAVQGGRIYRNLTGRVPIGSTIVEEDGAHHNH